MARTPSVTHSCLVSELVTNAARHAQSAVDLTGEHGRVRIEARDESSAIPMAPRVDRHRGLQLIEDLSEGWGVEVRGDDGKLVWCELASTGLARLKSAERRA